MLAFALRPRKRPDSRLAFFHRVLRLGRSLQPDAVQRFSIGTY